MYLHSDFDTTGVKHGLAHETCDEAWKVIANVLEVNTACGLATNLAKWEGMVEEHEQKHEDSANNCLDSTTADGVLAKMEALTGENNGIMLNYIGTFDAFYSKDFIPALESDTETPTSPVIWEWRDHNQWTDQALRPIPHTGTNGC